MKNINWWKYGILVAAVLALMYWARSCGINSVTKGIKSDTTITTHNDTSHTNPTPSKILPPDTIKITRWLKPEREEDTLWIDAEPPTIPPTDTLSELVRLRAIEKKYNQRVVYRDSAQGKDSAWKVFVDDTVQYNRLGRRAWAIRYKDTTKTNTIIKKPKKPLTLSVIASGMSNLKKPVYAEGGGLSLGLPSGAIYQVQIFHVPGQTPMVMISKTWVIRFGKKSK